MSTGLRAGTNNDGYLQVNGTDVLTALSSGRIGIGTDNPTSGYLLDVRGRGQFTSSTGYAADFIGVGGYRSQIYVDTLQTVLRSDVGIQFFPANSFALGITTTGKIGVNKTDPGCQSGGIHLVHSDYEGTPTFTGGEVGIFQRNFNFAQSCEISIVSGTASKSTINFGDKDDVDIGMIQYENNNDALVFTTNTSERLRIDSSGNVGIGSTNPSHPLDVNGVTKSTYFISTSYSVFGSIVVNDPGANYYSWNNRIGGGLAVVGTTFLDGNVGIGTDNPQGKLTVSNGSAGLEFNPNSEQAIVSYNRVTSAYTPVGLQGSVVSLGIGGVGEALRIDSNGRIHIGSNSAPLANLNINGTGGQGGGIQINRNTSGSPTNTQSLGSIAFKGVSSANTNAAAEAMIDAVAVEDHTGLTAATTMRFWVKGSGTGPGSAPMEAVRINSNGVATFIEGYTTDAAYSYFNQYTTDSSWGNAWVTVIPPGSLGYRRTYIVSLEWQYNGAGGAPFYLTGSCLFTTNAGTNGTGTENAVTLLSTTHTGGTGYYLEVRFIARTNASGGGSGGLQVKITGFSPSNGSWIRVNAQEVGYLA